MQNTDLTEKIEKNKFSSYKSPIFKKDVDIEKYKYLT